MLKAVAKVALTARDSLVWPSVVLALGLAIAFSIDRWFTFGAPKRLLIARLKSDNERCRDKHGPVESSRSNEQD